MPHPRVPTIELEARGSYAKDPQRRAQRADEPVPPGEIGDPPEYFLPALREIWFEFMREAAPGVLKSSDRKVLAQACRLEFKARNGLASAADETGLHKCLVSMGMTPADRSRVSVKKEKSTLKELLTEAAAESWPSTPEKPN